MHGRGSTWKKLTDNWFQKITITKKNILIYTYHYKSKTEKLCLAIEIDTPISRQINAYTLILKDLKDTALFLEEQNKIIAQKNTDHKGILLKALVRAIVITYGKCFAKADGRKIKLEGNIISEGNKEAHISMINMRNQYIAHAGTTNHEACKCIFLVPPQKNYLKDEEVTLQLVTELHQSVTSHFFAGEQCKLLIEEVQEKVQKKLSSLEEKLEEELKNISLTNIYEAAKNNKKRIILNSSKDGVLIFKPKDA